MLNFKAEQVKILTGIKYFNTK